MWSLCLCALLAAQPTERTDLEQGAVTLERAAMSIAETTGMRVRADASVAKEVVAFSVRRVTPAELLSRIADAIGAEVEKTKEGDFRLFRSDENRRGQAAAHLRRFAEEFRRVRDELSKGARLEQEADEAYFRAWRDRLARNDDLTDEERYFAAKRSDTERSEARFGIRLLEGVRPEDVARVPLGEFRLFRVNPTGRQFKLTLPNPSAELARFARERRAHLSAKPPPTAGEAREVLAPAQGGAYRMVHLPLEEPIREDLVEPVVFVGRRLDPRESLDLRAFAVTRDDRFVEIWGDLAMPNLGLEGFRVPTLPKGLPCEEERFRETMLAREFFERTRPTEAPGSDPISRDLFAKLQNPSDHDPWAFVTEALFQIARDGKVNLVFSPNDPTFSVAVHACAPERAVADLYRSLLRDGYRLDHRDGWLTIAPTDPVAAREAFLDRTRLGAFARTVARQGFADFRSQCLVATPIGVSRYGSPSGFTEMLLGVTTRRDAVSYVWPVEALWQRALGELPDARWRTLELGETVPALALTGASKQAVEALFYGGYLTMLGADGSTEGRVADSPTFAYPLTPPATLALSLAVEREEGLVGIGGNGRVRTADPRNLQSWARAQAWRERLQEPPIESVFRPATLLHRNYRLVVGPWFGPYQAEDFTCDLAQPGYTLDALPAAMARPYGELLELERGRANASRIAIDRKSPPPPARRSGPVP